jgi:hypothetical protein
MGGDAAAVEQASGTEQESAGADRADPAHLARFGRDPTDEPGIVLRLARAEPANRDQSIDRLSRERSERLGHHR